MKLNKNQIIILGAGGHAKVIASSLLRQRKKNILFVSEKVQKNSYFSSFKQISEKIFLASKFKNSNIYLGIGIVIKNNKRNQIIKKYLKHGLVFKKLIDKDAKIGLKVNIKDGVQILRGCQIGENVLINKNCIINTMSIIEHDVVIEENCHIAPGSIILGGAHICRDTFIGAGSIILQGVKIGSNSIIAAGSIVNKNLPKKSYHLMKK